MKLAFIADIHGNATALEAVLEDIKQRDVDETFFLGDLCFRGPEPKLTLDMVRSLNADVIKGNADEWVVRGIREVEVPEQALTMVHKERDWTYSKLNQEDLDYLKNLPVELNLNYENITIHAFHATPDSLFEMVQPSESDEVIGEKLMVKDAEIYLYAHIHKPYVRFLKGKCVVNTGSVGLPFDGSNNASYSLVEIDENSFTASIVRIEYDVDKVIRQIRDSDYPNKNIVDFLR
ncbi:YfcE family phosphodiesterase [Virgibacillus indicus]|uniref:YfcE family phosphodiesterase n=1 Tax=Virgibacillus indicus TaxID=2024554 RepID=A0A265NBR7_9BACI|nr:metallophosphoesterase family protein [Virgibacillus indicus]OZU89267.1 YfcE family phosphodiesterase [Virgibacillus indicus]